MDMRVKTAGATTDEGWVTACRLEDLIENMGCCALVKERQIALFLLSKSEEIFAIDNFDPFSQSNVLSRGVVGDLSGSLVVASPIYKQHFNLASGQCLEDESVKLTTYATRIVDGVVQVAVNRN